MSEPLRVLVADDEPLALDRLLFAFRDVPDTQVVATATNGIIAAEKIAEFKPDVAVLDVQMPGRTGLGVAADLPVDDRPEIIFLTAFDQHAIDAFAVEASDYILKPLRLDRLRQAIERARRRRAMRAPAPSPPPLSPARPDGDSDCFWVPDRRGMVRVDFDDVDWIEAAKDYVLLHTKLRSYLLRATMNAIEDQSEPSQFLRVHRSAFVRPGAVKSLAHGPSGGAVLILRDDVGVPVGPTYVREVEERFGPPTA